MGQAHILKITLVKCVNVKHMNKKKVVGVYMSLVADIYFASYLKLPQDVIFSLSPLLVLCFGCAFFKELG